MIVDPPLTRDLVLVGGGHAHALVLRRWGMAPMPGARLTVIDPGPTAPYTGMLPGHGAGHYARDELDIDLVQLCRFAGARLIIDRACGIDRAEGRIHLEGRGPVAYDVASLDIGITARMQIPGFAEHAVGAKPLGAYAQRWRAFLDRVKAGKAAPEVAVIGGGVAGCELAMAMSFALRAVGSPPRVTVIEAGPEISGVGARARDRLRRELARQEVVVHTRAEVRRIEADRVVLADGSVIAAAFCVGAAGAHPHEWLTRTDLPLEDGFIAVGPGLQVRGDPRLFAVGDCAHLDFAPRPKAGVYAVRAAPVLHDNLRSALREDGSLRRFKPQKNYLKLVSLGRKAALAEKWGFAVAGSVLWQWKDRIDRAFMDKFRDLPVMGVPKAPRGAAAGVADILDGAPLCGGCGAKVGQGVLAEALSALEAPKGAVATGAGDDATVLRLPGGGFQVLSTDHLRAIVADPARMARIAAVHALGDVFAMGGTPQIALASIVLPRMSDALQRRSLEEITAAATGVFREVGAQLTGGHTTMGAELTIGFTVTGTTDSPPVTVAGAQAGDLLLLTRPIGSGVIMAATMQGRAPGRVTEAALSAMERPQHREAAILSSAHAMTDVTGFGLCGHVQAICRASGLRATLKRRDIPIYDGARELSAHGIASALLPANMADAPVSGTPDPLLHDPQTAGGLLAALAPDAARDALARLQAEGLSGWIIGALEEGEGPIRIS